MTGASILIPITCNQAVKFSHVDLTSNHELKTQKILKHSTYSLIVAFLV